MKTLKTLMLSLLATAALVACNKTNEPTSPESPKIIDFGVTATDTTIKIGSKIEFKPTLNSTEGNTYRWNLDGKQVASTKDYTFTATQGGVQTITYTVSNESGISDRTLKITAKAYLGSFYIVNEGSFGNTPGSLNYYDQTADSVVYNVFEKNNTEYTLGNTTCFATQWGDNYYFVSKQPFNSAKKGGRLIAANRFSLAHTASLNELDGTDGRAFAGVDASNGIITTSRGAYRMSLNPLAMGAKITQTEDYQCGAVWASDKYAFIINQNKGLQIFDIKNNYNLVSEIKGVSVGFAHAKDGGLWMAATDSLIRIDPATLKTQSVKFPSGVKIYNSWGAWNCGSLVASPTEDVLYFTKGGMWGGGREIYRYRIGDISSLDQVFITSSSTTDNFNGRGIAVDPSTGDIVATFVHEGFSDFDDNRLVIFDAKTGAEKKRINYEGYWFPSMVIFN